MRVYNYASFAKVFSKGIIKPNMSQSLVLETVSIDMGNHILSIISRQAFGINKKQTFQAI